MFWNTKLWNLYNFHNDFTNYFQEITKKSSPEGGTDASPMMLRMIVGPALRNQERVRRLSHSCAPSELAVGF